MEAQSVVHVTRSPGFGAGARSGLLRAVGALVIVTDRDVTKEEGIGEAFDIVTI